MSEEIQAVIFSKVRGNWNEEIARAWLKRHQFKDTPGKETEQGIVFEMIPKKLGRNSRVVTDGYPEGVSIVKMHFPGNR